MNKVAIFAISGMALVCGCVTSDSNPYRDPTEVRGGREFSSYDLQQCAASMVDAMLSNAALDRKSVPGQASCHCDYAGQQQDIPHIRS